jgi:hypothetical protein
MCNDTVLAERGMPTVFVAAQVTRFVAFATRPEARELRAHWLATRSHWNSQRTSESANFRPSRKRTRVRFW